MTVVELAHMRLGAPVALSRNVSTDPHSEQLPMLLQLCVQNCHGSDVPICLCVRVYVCVCVCVRQ